MDGASWLARIARTSPCTLKARSSSASVVGSISRYSIVCMSTSTLVDAGAGDQCGPRLQSRMSAPVHPIRKAHVLAAGRRALWKGCTVGVIDQPDLPGIVALRREARDVGFPQHRPEQGFIRPVPGIIAGTMEQLRLNDRALQP